MKINKQKKLSKKIITLVVTVFVIIIASVFAYVYLYNGNLFGWKKADSSTKNDAAGPATQEQIDNGNSIKQDTINSSSNSSKGSTSPSPSPSSSPTSGKSNAGVVITAVNQNDNTLQIRSIVDLLTNSGTCTLTLTKGTQTVTKTATVQAQVSTSACQGFDVPVSELSAGTWNIGIHFENDQYKGDALTTVSIQ